MSTEPSFRHFTFNGAEAAKADYDHLLNGKFRFAENDLNLYQLTDIVIKPYGDSGDRYHVLFMSGKHVFLPIREFMDLNNIEVYDFDKYEHH